MRAGEGENQKGPGLPRLPPGRHGLPREVVIENQRRRIAAGMIAVVVERGYNETTVTQVVAAAGVSRRTFYNYYAEFLEQRHIKTICTRPQFAAEKCPAASVYGTAQAFSPLLAQPLEGPVYLRSAPERKLPDLVADLHGGGLGLRIEVVGHIDSVHGGLRGTFEGVPDAPVSRFVMNLKGGKQGLLVNSQNLCGSKQFGNALFVGHNNVGISLRPKLEVDCKKQKSAKKKAGR